MSWVCLMFHDVLPATEASGGGAERFAVPVTAFERWLDTIKDAEFAGCSVATAVATPDRRRVAISFDDGTRSQFDHAVPALRARGMTATFYVTTDWIGRPGYMTWDELRQLTAWGMSVQSHTRSHRFLSELSDDALRDELAGSKAVLDAELAQDTAELSFPGGNAPRRRWRVRLWEAGYRRVAGSRWGRNPDDAPPSRWIRRCTARGSASPAEMRRVLAGDPWLTLTRYPREAALNGVRAALGASRYERWRRRVLDAFRPGSGPTGPRAGRTRGA